MVKPYQPYFSIKRNYELLRLQIVDTFAEEHILGSQILVWLFRRKRKLRFLKIVSPIKKTKSLLS